jgi:hypothetical protein
MDTNLANHGYHYQKRRTCRARQAPLPGHITLDASGFADQVLQSYLQSVQVMAGVRWTGGRVAGCGNSAWRCVRPHREGAGNQY